MNRIWNEKRSEVETYGIIESIERTVYCLQDHLGEWVRYMSHYYPLHSPKEYTDLAQSIRTGRVSFFNNESPIAHDEQIDVDSLATIRQFLNEQSRHPLSC